MVGIIAQRELEQRMRDWDGERSHEGRESYSSNIHMVLREPMRRQLALALPLEFVGETHPTDWLRPEAPCQS